MDHSSWPNTVQVQWPPQRTKTQAGPQNLQGSGENNPAQLTPGRAEETAGEGHKPAKAVGGAGGRFLGEEALQIEEGRDGAGDEKRANVVEEQGHDESRNSREINGEGHCLLALPV